MKRQVICVRGCCCLRGVVWRGPGNRQYHLVADSGSTETIRQRAGQAVQRVLPSARKLHRGWLFQREADHYRGSTLAEHWNGSSWTVQQVPLPAGAYEADLTGVACPGATQCVAVGHYNDLTTGGVPFAAWWNGTGWTAQAMSGPATGDPNAVSCSSQAACSAVGWYNTKQPLAIHEI